MRRLYFLFPCLLFACSSSSDQIIANQEQKQEHQATETCLNSPEQWKAWGECNVKKTIFDQLPKIQTCYEAGEGQENDVKGDLILEIHLRPSGWVRKVEIREGSLKNPLLSGCLIKEIGKLKFAKPPKDSKPVIHFPFSLDLVKVGGKKSS